MVDAHVAMTFEELVRIIRQRLAFGMSLAEIHDRLVDSLGMMVSEQDFFFAWCAAKTYRDEDGGAA